MKYNSTVVIIGDSISDVKFNRRALNLKAHPAYPKQIKDKLAKKHNAKFVFSGIASDRIYHIYDRFTKDCFLHKPDYIVMLIGVNDAWQIYKKEDYPIEKNPSVIRTSEPCFKEILRRIKYEMPACQLIALLPFLIDTIPEKRAFIPYLEDMRNMEVRLLKEFGFNNIIDLQKVFTEASKIYAPKDLALDGVHPTKLGHSIIADEVIKILTKID
ncbi:MAG TPA: GDSL-type esterase/lipase family protein [Clostridia bacterium]|jgi:lysophospholipase L1-like esterase|nr:GDSL-type esterase/lipase family protein [Clostridia bacterium]